MILRFTKSFEKEFASITRGNKELKKKIIRKLEVLMKNPNHPSLRLHKLGSGKYWSISMDKSIRVLIFFQEEFIYIYHIGKHEDVY